MKAVLLAGGFGTRLEKGARLYSHPDYKSKVQEWVIGKSKGLIPIRGKVIVNYQLEQLLNCGINKQDIYVHSNEVHKKQYLSWADTNGIPRENVFSNGVRSNSEKLEQVKDMILAIQNVGTSSPLLMLACDTLVYNENNKVHCFKKMIQDYHQDQKSRVVVYKKDHNLSKHGIVQTDREGNVIGFEEKPENPKSNLVNASIYLYHPAKLQEILDEKVELSKIKNPLQVIWPNFIIEIADKRVDIGCIEDVLISNNIPFS